MFDVVALNETVSRFAPDVVMHQLTDLPDDRTRIPDWSAANARMRREGTRNLLAAARAAGGASVIAQSVAWQLRGDAAAAVAEHERSVLRANGLVLRYGQFYGPGTYYESELPIHPRVHIDEAARQTLRGARSGPGRHRDHRRAGAAWPTMTARSRCTQATECRRPASASHVSWSSMPSGVS